MSGRIPARAAKLAGAMLAAGAALALTAGASAASETIYSNMPSPTPGNVVSQPFQAAQMAQFGGVVEFAGAARKAGSVTVGMSSWACEKGNWTGGTECTTVPGAKYEYPITLKIYEEGPLNEVGALLRGVTKTFKMPYRPSQNNAKCTGAAHGAWYSVASKQCFHGKFFKIVFTVPRLVWPAKAIISVAYNTSNYGAEPQGAKPCTGEPAGCFYDSLNVGLTEPPNELLPTPVAPSVGTDPQPADAYSNTITPGNYCDKGVGGTGTFRLDAGCWTGYQPLLRVHAGS
jgi:hypothetical protein